MLLLQTVESRLAIRSAHLPGLERLTVMHHQRAEWQRNVMGDGTMEAHEAAPAKRQRDEQCVRSLGNVQQSVLDPAVRPPRIGGQGQVPAEVQEGVCDLLPGTGRRMLSVDPDREAEPCVSTLVRTRPPTVMRQDGGHGPTGKRPEGGDTQPGVGMPGVVDQRPALGGRALQEPARWSRPAYRCRQQVGEQARREGTTRQEEQRVQDDGVESSGWARIQMDEAPDRQNTFTATRPLKPERLTPSISPIDGGEARPTRRGRARARGTRLEIGYLMSSSISSAASCKYFASRTSQERTS
jgi:hypothetical protein